MSCGTCDFDSHSSKEEKNEQFKCKSCGSISDKQEDCCDSPKEKLCACGSQKYAKECCEV